MITIYRATKGKTTAEFLTEAEAFTFSDIVEVIEKELSDQVAAEAWQIEKQRVDTIYTEIARLEGLITPRRVREAVLTDAGKGWLMNIEQLINNQRSQL